MKKLLSMFGAAAMLALTAGTTYACDVVGYVNCATTYAPIQGVTIDITGTSTCGGSFSASIVTDQYGIYYYALPDCVGTYTVCVDTTTLPPGEGIVGNSCTNFSVNPVTSPEGVADFFVNCSGPATCPPVDSCIGSGFNGTTTPTSDYVWFNANFSAQGVPSTGAVIVFNNSEIVINAPTGTFTYPVPDGEIIFDPSVTCSSTSFDGTEWVTILPVQGSDEIFLSGLGIPVPANLKASTVSWCGDFSSTESGVSVNWKWGAAVYTSPITAANYNSLDVKPTHSAACGYNNGDHAGTPENQSVQKAVTGGARGGGGSNFTGSWSGTAGAALCP